MVRVSLNASTTQSSQSGQLDYHETIMQLCQQKQTECGLRGKFQVSAGFYREDLKPPAAWREGNRSDGWIRKWSHSPAEVWTPVSSSTWISVNAPNNFPLIEKTALWITWEAAFRWSSESKKLQTPDLCVSESPRRTNRSLSEPPEDRTPRYLRPAETSYRLRWRGYCETSDQTTDSSVYMLQIIHLMVGWGQREQDGSQSDLLQKKGVGLRGWPLTQDLLSAGWYQEMEHRSKWVQKRLKSQDVRPDQCWKVTEYIYSSTLLKYNSE